MSNRYELPEESEWQETRQPVDEGWLRPCSASRDRAINGPGEYTVRETEPLRRRTPLEMLWRARSLGLSQNRERGWEEQRWYGTGENAWLYGGGADRGSASRWDWVLSRYVAVGQALYIESTNIFLVAGGFEWHRDNLEARNDQVYGRGYEYRCTRPQYKTEMRDEGWAKESRRGSSRRFRVSSGSPGAYANKKYVGEHRAATSLEENTYGWVCSKAPIAHGYLRGERGYRCWEKNMLREREIVLKGRQVILRTRW